MSTWDAYPANYRSREIAAILSAVLAGECVSVVGLSGSGKSNLLGYIAHRNPAPALLPEKKRPLKPGWPAFYLVDCNRLTEPSLQAFARLALTTLEEKTPVPGEEDFLTLEKAIGKRLKSVSGVCLLLDRFDFAGMDTHKKNPLAANLRALRDAYKYELTYVTASRHPLDAHSELAELFYAHTLWLGALSASDAVWTVSRYMERRGLEWDEPTIQELIRLSGGYPSFLRAACEAHSLGAGLDSASLAAHPAVRQRLDEFWSDQPSLDELHKSGLAGHPWLETSRPVESGKPATAGEPAPEIKPAARETLPWILTAKENLLWEYLQNHPQQVCEKDDLIRAVWPEDRIFERGIRDDSLAQLVRRLREKVEADPSSPCHIHTVPGRGYRYTP